MALKQPKSASEVRYLKRKIIGKGKVKIWIFYPNCPKCKEGYLVIPYDEKTGRYKSRGKFFECNKCDYKESKVSIKSEIPIANIEYTCPHCGYSGEKQEPFKKTSSKKFKFKCDKCGKDIRIEGA